MTARAESLQVVSVIPTGVREWEGLIRDGENVWAWRIARTEWRCDCDRKTYMPPITPDSTCRHLAAAAQLPIYA